MKKIFLSFAFLFICTINAIQIVGSRKYSDFDSAKKEASLTWIVTSTKVGLFSSDVHGYVLDYSYKAEYDEKNNILRDMELSFPILAMDSDSDSRDTKLRNKCLGNDQYKKITIKINGPIFLKDQRNQEYTGTVTIRGKNKKFTINIKPDLSDNRLKIKGTSRWSLSKMEIPDPSIAVAKLSDDIRIIINIDHNLDSTKGEK